MIKKRRVFIALNLPDIIKQHCVFIQELIKKYCEKQALDLPRITYIPPEHLHITLQAPMHLDDTAIERLTNALQTITFNTFQLCTTDLYYLKRNQLIWLNVIAEHLEELVLRIHECIRKTDLNIKREEPIQPFKGHITLIRHLLLKDPEALLKPVNESIESLCFSASELVLKETIPEEGRVIGYQDIAQFPLQ